MDTSGKWGRCRSEAARPSSTTVQEAHHTASSRVAAARGRRPAAAAAGAADGAAGAGAAAAVAADGGPVDRRAGRLPTFVAAGARATRSAREAVREEEADRSTRGSRSAVLHRLARTAVRPAVVCGGTVCGGTASSDCGGSSRADGAGHRGTRRTGLAAAPAGSGPAPEAGAAQGIGGWPKQAATGSTMAAAADGKSPVAAGNGRNRVVSARTST